MRGEERRDSGVARHHLFTIWSRSPLPWLQWCHCEKRWYQLQTRLKTSLEQGDTGSVPVPCINTLLQSQWVRNRALPPRPVIHTLKYWSYFFNGAEQITLSLFSFVDNGCLAGKIHHILELLCHLRSETSSAGSPLISLSGPETAQALSQNLSGPGEHNASSITGASSTGFLFYWGGPLQRPGPLSFHIRVPTPVIWLTSTETLFHSCLFLSLYSSCPIYLYFSVSPSLPPVAPSLFSLLMRSELVLKIMTWSRGQSCKWNAHLGTHPRQNKEGMC